MIKQNNIIEKNKRKIQEIIKELEEYFQNKKTLDGTVKNEM